jgi:Spy/CpxP family protein refolding chaperone
MKRLQLLMVTLLTGVLTTGTLHAEKDNTDVELKQEYHFKGGKHFGKQHLGKLLKQLELTDTQKTSLKSLREEKRAERKAMFKEMRKVKQTTLAKAITAEGFNKEAFIKEATKHFEVNITKRAAHMEKLLAILTAEQRVQFATLLKSQN